MKLAALATLAFFATTTPMVAAGPASYAACQTSCNTKAVACYAAAGLTFGTVVAGPAAPIAAMACNAELSSCTKAFCAPLLIVPAP